MSKSKRDYIAGRSKDRIKELIEENKPFKSESDDIPEHVKKYGSSSYSLKGNSNIRSWF